MKTEQHELLVKRTAHQIVKALEAFKDGPGQNRQRAIQEVMGRVNRMLNGDGGLTIEGPGLVTEVTAPINTAETDKGVKGEGPEGV